MPKYLFPNGVATATGAYLIGQISSDFGKPIQGSLYVDYKYSRESEGFATDWIAVSICNNAGENAVYAAGENGEILRITDSGNSEEFVGNRQDGPATHGPIREIRKVGNDLFCVGMGRQIYKRTNAARWEHFDAQILDSSGHLTSGLSSITGDERGFFIAVGFDGEIWEFMDGWMQIDSPTNVLLTRVTPYAGKYYAAGMAGTIMCRDPDGWSLVDNSEFIDDIWDLTTFQGSLYLGTVNGLLRMSSDQKIKTVELAPHTQQLRCTGLSAEYGRLWCFGEEIVSSSADGKIWREELPF